MARSSAAQPSLHGHSKRIGGCSVLVPDPPSPATPVQQCLEELSRQWQSDGSLAGLWQAWPRIAGPQLAEHCHPLHLQGGLLTVGAPPGPWLQALQYARHQLLGALRGAGFTVRDIKLRQHYPAPLPPAASLLEQEVWAQHPSRIDVHGLEDCPRCLRPAPLGELARWGHCGFCRRADLAT